jgi:hypothetical protein
MQHLSLFNNESDYIAAISEWTTKYCPLVTNIELVAGNEFNNAREVEPLSPTYESTFDVSHILDGIIIKTSRELTDNDYIYVWLIVPIEDSDELYSEFYMGMKLSKFTFESGAPMLTKIDATTYSLPSCWWIDENGVVEAKRIGLLLASEESPGDITSGLTTEIGKMIKVATLDIPQVSYSLDDDIVHYNSYDIVFEGEENIFPKMDYSKLPTELKWGVSHPEFSEAMILLRDKFLPNEDCYITIDSRFNWYTQETIPYLYVVDETGETVGSYDITNERFYNYYFKKLKIDTSYSQSNKVVYMRIYYYDIDFGSCTGFNYAIDDAFKNQLHVNCG